MRRPDPASRPVLSEEHAMSNEADSIYQPPTANLERPGASRADAGSLQRGIDGDFTLDVQAVLTEAWALTRGSKGAIIGGAVIAYGISLVSGLASAAVTGSDPAAGANVASVLITIAGYVIPYPIWAGIFMYAIRRAAGEDDVLFGDIFAYFPRLPALVGLYVLQTALIALGFVLLVLPGIYLTFAYYFSTPLLLDKGLGIWDALETSRKAITHVWFGFFGMLLVVGLATAIGSVITLGIGAIWLLPWSILCVAVAYHRAFGYGPEPA
jgi:hypothetical protein